MVAPFNVSIDDLEEMEIYGPDGEEIGEVDEVLVDAQPSRSRSPPRSGAFLTWARRTW